MSENSYLSGLEGSGKIKAAVKYAESFPETLSKFMDVSTALIDDIIKNPQKYETCNIELNNTKKAFDILSKSYIKDSRVSDLSEREEKIEGEAGNILNSIQVSDYDYKTVLSVNQTLKADMYLYISRGNHSTITDMTITKETEFCIQNSFNCYGTESFLFALRMEKVWVAVEPTQASGMKGSCDVLVYALTEEGKVYKDLASKYFDCSPILNVYQG